MREFDDIQDAGDNDRVVVLRPTYLNLLRSIVSHRGDPVVREILVEGPRGTGKSKAVLQIVYTLCHLYPGLKVLLCRNKRKSMSGTTLPEWESCMAEGDPALDGPKPEGRSVYRIGDSEVLVAGLDESDRLRSMTRDVIYYEEGTESESPEHWESLHGALRSFVMPQQLLITSVNPKQPGHWLNIRAERGMIERIRTRFQDNPKLYDDNGVVTPQGAAFIKGLQRLTGHRYRRDYLGEWSAASGLVFPEFEPSTHMLGIKRVRSLNGDVLEIEGWKEPVEVDWYGVSLDFGYRAPGVCQVWAVNNANQMCFRVAEVYQPGRQLDWWADVLCSLHDEFPFESGVGDSAEPRTIDFLNDRLGYLRGRSMARVIHKADKSAGKVHGLDQLRFGLKPMDNAVPRTYFAKNALRYGVCAQLVEDAKPTCFEEEIPRYVWDEADPNKPQMEKDESPSYKCADHAIDAAVYFHVFAWKRTLGRRIQQSSFKPGTYGSTFKLGGKEIEWPNYRNN